MLKTKPNPRKKKVSGSDRNAYFIARMLDGCPWEFQKVDDIWYKRKKRSKDDWEEVVYE